MNLFYLSSPSTFFHFAAPRALVLRARRGARRGRPLRGLRAGAHGRAQGEVYRVIFIHVPAAWMSMFIYFVMACYGAMALTFNSRLAAMMARALAPTGAMFTFVALWTGAFWGRPTGAPTGCGTRASPRSWCCSSSISASSRSPTPSRTRAAGDRAAALLAIIGIVNLPIIYFSVQWWNTLHQGSSVKLTGTSMHVSMFTAMMLMTFACWMYAIGASLVRVRSIILERERRTRWVRALRPPDGPPLLPLACRTAPPPSPSSSESGLLARPRARVEACRRGA
jgi:heme exporter protein C